MFQLKLFEIKTQVYVNRVNVYIENMKEDVHSRLHCLKV